MTVSFRRKHMQPVRGKPRFGLHRGKRYKVSGTDGSGGGVIELSEQIVSVLVSQLI